uniref:Transmembrane protein n=1 Tax=Fagus sylvatica TaxID=28930 RepID=A0A2N9FD41_FAGSY
MVETLMVIRWCFGDFGLMGSLGAILVVGFVCDYDSTRSGFELELMGFVLITDITVMENGAYGVCVDHCDGKW